MRKFMILLVMFIMATTVFGQKKGKVDPEQAAIDSLTKANTALSATLDSVTKDRNTYYGVYEVIIDKVIKYPFDPAKTAFLIDSLKTSRDSTMLGLSEPVKVLQAENAKLKASIDSLNLAYADNSILVNELKQLKELLDAGIITQEDFDVKKAAVMEQWK